MNSRVLFLATLMACGPAAVLAQSQAPPPSPQQPQITFRAEVNYVEVDARVLDKDGRFITGLTPEDFQVFEDGKPQKITAFSMVNIPVERVERPLFASKLIERDVRTNLEGADGRRSRSGCRNHLRCRTRRAPRPWHWEARSGGST